MRVPFTRAIAAAALSLTGACTAVSDRAMLRFSVKDGAIANDFIRDGPVAAHIVLTSGLAPRLIAAFPAGNSGAGVWFESGSAPVEWGTPQSLKPVSQTLDGGAAAHGVTFDVVARTGALEIRQALLGNIRTLREFEQTGSAPAETLTAPTVTGERVEWRRQRVDGAPGYFLSIEARNGSATRLTDAQTWVLRADASEALRLRVTALTGEKPLTGIAKERLFSPTAAPDDGLRNALAFLAYEEKLLAGSWQYDSYFGRDTLMTLALLGSALRPPAIEAGLASVIERLSDRGEVAHEEDVGEYAALRRRREGRPASDEAFLDYKMVDDDFMLAPVLARYFLQADEGRARAQAFFSRRARNGETYGALARRNLAFVVGAARPYGAAPHWSRLISLQAVDPPVGNWRDSAAGLGGGAYPYDINAALVPAALTAVAGLGASGLLGADGDVRALAAEAARLSEIWSGAAAHFTVEIGAQRAFRAQQEAAGRLGIAAPPEARATPMRFPAVALDIAGAPVPVMHSDVGFLLFFGTPSEEQLMEAAEAAASPFPAGLMTPAGMVVANAAYAPVRDQALFGPSRYHGAVVWSWQQALMRAGLARQVQRTDISATVRGNIQTALTAVDAAIDASAAYGSSELWTWTVKSGAIVRAPFGQNSGDETEANAIQLWSAVLLNREER